MWRLAGSVVVCAGFACGVVGCSSGTSAKKVTTATTLIPRTATTLRGVPATVSPVTFTTAPIPTPTSSAATVPAAAVSTDRPTDSTSPFTTPPARSTPVATVAGRVVTKPNDNVHRGDTGAGVKQIQTALAAHGYRVATDGTFGAQTEEAVTAFQAKNGLAQDGIVGPATWAKLQAASTGTTTKPTAGKPATTTIKTTTTVRH